jgi:hypothetical protein
MTSSCQLCSVGVTRAAVSRDHEMTMRLHTGLMAAVLVAGWLTTGCDSADNRTATSSADPAAGPSAPPSDPSAPPAPQPTPPTSARCDVTRAQWAVGQQASDDLLERARIDAGATTARFLRPNQPITMEYFDWRLNLGLDEQDVVSAATCG